MKIKNIALGFMGFIIRAAILAVAVLAIYKAGQKAYDFGFRIFTEEPMSPEPGRDVAVTIVQGDSTMNVAEMFEEKGLIRDAKLFYVQKLCSVYDNDIQPGFYTLNTSMTAEDMFAVIAGKSDEERTTEDEENFESEFDTIPLSDSSPMDEVTGDWEGAEDEGDGSSEDETSEGDNSESDNNDAE